jgi:thioredoxin reductase
MKYRSAYLFETMKDFPDTLFDKRLRKDIRGIDEGKINVVFKSNVKEIKDKSVVLTTPEGEIELLNDYVFIFIGGTLPYEFLKKVGINIVQKSGN